MVIFTGLLTSTNYNDQFLFIYGINYITLNSHHCCPYCQHRNLSLIADQTTWLVQFFWGRKSKTGQLTSKHSKTTANLLICYGDIKRILFWRFIFYFDSFRHLLCFGWMNWIVGFAIGFQFILYNLFHVVFGFFPWNFTRELIKVIMLLILCLT